MQLVKSADLSLLGPHPVLVEAQADLDTSRATVTEVQAEYHPSVDLFTKASIIGRSESSVDNAFSDLHRGRAVVGVRLNKWNWFNGGQTTSLVARTEAGLEQNSLRVIQVRDDLRSEKGKVVGARLRAHDISEVDYQAAQVEWKEKSTETAKLEIDLLIARIKLELAKDL